MAEDAGVERGLRRRHHHGGLAQRIGERREAFARRRRRQDPQHELAGARDAHRRAESGLVVFVGDLEAALGLLLVRVLAHAIVIEAQVHRAWRPAPRPTA